MAACARSVSRATRRLLRAHRRGLDRDMKLVSPPAGDQHHKPSCTGREDETEGDDGLWRRAILMGERRKPLDFLGVIHYDNFDRRLSAPPLARGGGSKAALLCRSMHDVDEAAVVVSRKVVARHT